MESFDALKGVHYAQEKLLQEVDRICKKHDIPYYLWAGTLLGAVRHKDFIPWDDDVDVAFKRPDFEKFLSVAPDELAAAFELVMPGENNRFFDMIPKINYVSSRLFKTDPYGDYYNGRHNRVSLDLFCLDMPKDGFRFKLQLLRLKTLYGYAMGHRKKLDYSDYAFHLRPVIWGLSLIGKTMSMETILRKHKKASCGTKNSDSLCIFNERIFFIHPRFRAEWFENTKEFIIREQKYTSMAGYDSYLKFVYHDYNSLPPEEKRIPEHSGTLDEIEVKDLDGNII